MRCVIFDLDGTLADTSADLAAAANACFREAGYGELLDPVADRGAALRGGRSMLRLGFARLGRPESDEIDALYPRLLEHYGANLLVHSTLFPGVAEAVAALTARGYRIGICTNKPEAMAHDLMTGLGARDWFGALVGADTLTVKKPDPAALREAVDRVGGDMGATVLVGDTETDHRTARAAGAKSLLVTFGPEGGDIARLAPDGLLHHFDDLGAEVERLIG
ncbi:HAD family hydrolase [Mesobaculum littorinae]|uniref:phosphoglycolate phosphatase n=1 Tax=Mesobaculum littorinae TaxID=2486419 RepID=A0A438AE09_9RHOB|nr:HAD-IA family hydrolase [Mesobaculum littorinae]RVV96943.1 HAD family hydrolase [Mesobaculum littorinae]